MVFIQQNFNLAKREVVGPSNLAFPTKPHQKLYEATNMLLFYITELFGEFSEFKEINIPTLHHVVRNY